MNDHNRTHLRSKTGCLTCRERRKKCDERLPICERCKSSGRKCKWPTAADLLDRRFASHCQSRHQSFATKPIPKYEETYPGEVQVSRIQKLCLLPSESAVVHGAMTRNVEILISQHFVNRYYHLLLLPKCHPGFYSGWLTEIQDLMTTHKCLYYSVLACAASHIHLIDTSSPMQGLALTYYSKAIKQLSRLLTTTSQPENHNGVLMTVMLLYIHGCMGRGTYTDISRHVTAATRIISSRYFNRTIRIDRLFDKLAIESVLYHIFLLTTGLWSDSTRQDYNFDSDFWAQAEEMLDQSTIPGTSRSFNSPVIGVPVSLFRLGILLRQQYRDYSLTYESMSQLRSEVLEWETALLDHNHSSVFQSNIGQLHSEEGYYRDASCLYAIVVSLLQNELPHGEPGPPCVRSCDSWQIRKAIQILQKYENDDGWARCYIGNWPIYTLGFFTASLEDQQIIQVELQRRWDLTRFAQVARFSSDLINTWAAREQAAAVTPTTSLSEEAIPGCCVSVTLSASVDEM